mgnify:CR=1 FL=1
MFFVTILMLILFFFINYKIYHSDFIAPACVYSFSLLVPALYALFWYDLWELRTYSVKTFFVIFVAVFTFSIVSGITYNALNGNRILIKSRQFDVCANKSSDNKIAFGGGKLLLLLIIGFFTLKLALDFFKTYGDDLASSIIAYRLDFVKEEKRMPKLLSFLLNFCMLSGYFSSYIFINNLLCAKKIEFGWICAFLGSIMLSLFGGSRGGAVSVIFVAAGIFYIIYQHNPRKLPPMKMKKNFLKAILFGGITGFVFFIISASWIGRTNDFSPLYYFAIYFSAPLKNLDLYIPLIELGRELDFMEINGASLGNVGTVLAFEYQYGGFWGVISFTALSSVIYTVTYIYMRRWRFESDKINFSAIIYSYMFYSLCIVMFGGTSITSIFSLFFVKIFIGLIVLNYFFNFSFNRKRKSWGLGKTHSIFCLRIKR